MIYEALVFITTMTLIIHIFIVVIVAIEIGRLFRDYTMADSSFPTPANCSVAGTNDAQQPPRTPTNNRPVLPYLPQAKPRIGRAPDYRPYLNTNEVGIDRQQAKASYARMLADMYCEEMWSRAHTEHLGKNQTQMTFNTFKSTANPDFHRLNTEIFQHAMAIHIWILQEEGGPNSTEVAKHLRYLAYITRHFPCTSTMLDEISEGEEEEFLEDDDDECTGEAECECDACQRYRMEHPHISPTPSTRTNPVVVPEEITPTPVPSPSTHTD